MSTETTTEAKFTRIPAAARHGDWAGQCAECDEHQPAPHIVVWTENGRLYVDPECGDRDQAPKVAGLLFLAGVPIELTQEGKYDPKLTTGNEHRSLVVRTLHEAGADLTVIYPAGDVDF